MSDRLCAAFFLPFGEQPPPSSAEQLASQAGMTEIETRPWGLAGRPTVLGMWGGVACEAHVLTLEYFYALVLTFRKDEFHALRESSGEDLPEDGALSVAYAFRDACITLDPVAAFITADAWWDPFCFVSSQEERVLNGDLLAMTRENFGLLYLSPADVAELDTTRLLADRDAIVADGGLLLFRGKGRDRWLLTP